MNMSCLELIFLYIFWKHRLEDILGVTVNIKGLAVLGRIWPQKLFKIALFLALNPGNAIGEQCSLLSDYCGGSLFHIHNIDEKS